MTCTIQLSEQETTFVQKYLDEHNISLQDLFKNALFERIENEYDLLSYEQGIKEFEENPATYTIDEIERELGLNEI